MHLPTSSQKHAGASLVAGFGPHGAPNDEGTEARASERGALDGVVERTIAAAVTEAERSFSFVRVGFCAAAFTLFLALDSPDKPGHGGRLALEIAALGLATFHSAWVLRTCRTRSFTTKDRLVSVAVDSAICTLAVATSTLFPAPDYRGLLGSLDVAAAPLVVVTAAFRVHPPSAVLSSALTTLGLTGLLLVDLSRGLALHVPSLAFLGVYLAWALALALFLTARARVLFGRVGLAATRAEAARGSVLSLLVDHHDLRSHLCDLRLKADLFAESSADDAARARDALLSSVTHVTGGAAKTRDRALAALEAIEQPGPVNLVVVLERATEIGKGLGLAITLDTSDLPRNLDVWFGGGEAALVRVFEQLLVNAREGNGKRGAETVRLVASRVSRDRVRVVIDDDGPGWTPAVRAAAGRSHGTTTKPGSSGLGLWLATSAVRAAGGHLGLGEPSSRAGARVTIELGWSA